MDAQALIEQPTQLALCNQACPTVDQKLFLVHSWLNLQMQNLGIQRVTLFTETSPGMSVPWKFKTHVLQGSTGVRSQKLWQPQQSQGPMLVARRPAKTKGHAHDSLRGQVGNKNGSHGSGGAMGNWRNNPHHHFEQGSSPQLWPMGQAREGTPHDRT